MSDRHVWQETFQGNRKAIRLGLYTAFICFLLAGISHVALTNVGLVSLFVLHSGAFGSIAFATIAIGFYIGSIDSRKLCDWSNLSKSKKSERISTLNEIHGIIAISVFLFFVCLGKFIFMESSVGLCSSLIAVVFAGAGVAALIFAAASTHSALVVKTNYLT